MTRVAGLVSDEQKEKRKAPTRRVSPLDLVDPVIKATAKKIDRRDSTYRSKKPMLTVLYYCTVVEIR
jgi:hypothetical protein